MTVTVGEERFKSYDANNAKTFIIDEGVYYLTVGTDAHRAVNNILAAKGKTAADGMTGEGDPALTAEFRLDFDAETYAVSDATGYAIANQFDFADLRHYWEDVVYLSRSDWEGTFPTHLQLTAPRQLIDDLDTEATYLQENPGDEAPVTGRNTGIQLITLRGAEFEDSQWETFLDQMTAQEMFELVQLGGWRTMETPGWALWPRCLRAYSWSPMPYSAMWPFSRYRASENAAAHPAGNGLSTASKAARRMNRR